MCLVVSMIIPMMGCGHPPINKIQASNFGFDKRDDQQKYDDDI